MTGAGPSRPDPRHLAHSWLTLPVALLATGLTFALGYWQKYACHAAGWPYDRQLIFGERCYSDVPVLLHDRGLAAGIFPYALDAGAPGLEYPVLSGLVMDVTARLARWLAPAGGGELSRSYFNLTVLVLLACALVTVWATARTSGRVRDGLLVGVAPTLALAGTINWDLVAVAATALALLAWARDRPWLAGACIGLGTAAKLYPLLLLGPILLLALRARRARPAVAAVAGAAAAWLAVNLPVALAHPGGWVVFYRFNQERGAEFGSIWYALKLLGHEIPELNLVVIGLLGAACLGIAALALRAADPPPLPVLAFLVVAAFLVTNKVYSPQYVLWLLPLAVLAGVRLPDLAGWQVAEVIYWYAVWSHLVGGVSDRWYAAATFLRVAVTLWLCGRMVVAVVNNRAGRVPAAGRSTAATARPRAIG